MIKYNDFGCMGTDMAILECNKLGENIVLIHNALRKC